MCIKASLGNVFKYSRVCGRVRAVNAPRLRRLRFACRVSMALDDVSFKPGSALINFCNK